MFAQVVFNLPIEGPFDYFIPPGWESRIKPGMRVIVSFGRNQRIGYVVGKTKETLIKETKPILKALDENPVLDKAMLKITHRVSRYYACCWGEVIETALPQTLRRARTIRLQIPESRRQIKKAKSEMVLLHDLGAKMRWEVYLDEIKANLKLQKGIIFLTPNIESAKSVCDLIKEKLGQDNIALFHSQQPAKEELEQWIKVKEGKIRIVVGTRLAIFLPLINLGLIIIDEEHSPVYKQEQVPHYHACQVARIRAEIEAVKIILCSRTPSLETWHQVKSGRIKYVSLDTRISVGQVKIIDLHRVGFIPQRKRIRLSVALEDAISSTLAGQGRVLLFFNRRGFAISASCQNCGRALSCPRCDTNLIFHFKENRLVCHHCNYKTPLPKVCPNCNCAYIRYSGLGTEKLESELSRLFPQVNISRLDKDEKSISQDARIIISTEYIFKRPPADLQLVGVLSVDALLNRPDFRAPERTFGLLLHLATLSDKTLIIQTNLPQHYCFEALTQRSLNFFYENELKFRRQAGFPPFNHLIMVRLRGRKEERLISVAQELYEILNKLNRDKSIKIFSVSPQIPPKKRDRFYAQILLKTRSVSKAADFLKKALSDFRRSGIIITVDVDPV